MFKFIISLIFSFSLTYSVTIVNRFKVPVYVSISTSIGYDENFLRLSPSDLISANKFPSMISDSKSTNSMVNRNNIGLEYGPYLFKDHETRVKLNLSRNLYQSLSKKSYNKYSLSIAQHLGPFEWLKLSYSLLPELYLREYVDKDNPVYDSSESLSDFDSSTVGELYTSSFFSTEVMRIQYSHPIPFHKSYYSLSYSKQKQYYNGEFTEFDLDINDFKVGIYLRHIPHVKISANVSKSVADNVTFQEGSVSTQTKDRGFEQSRMWASVIVDERYIPFFDELGMSTSFDKRAFSSNLITDPLHKGRSHSDRKTSLWVKKQISNKLIAKFSGSYRSRTTTSIEEFVEGLKSFNKYDFFIKFTYNSNFNIYY